MLNHIVIMGRLTRDPELRRTASGIACTSFTLAVDRDFAPRGSDEKGCDFIECIAWRQAGEFVSKYFTKGRMAVVSGRLEIRDWTDKEGNKRKTAEVNVANIYFGDSKKEVTNASAAAQVSGSSPSAPAYGDFAPLNDEDAQLPF